MFAVSLCLCRGPAHVDVGGCTGRRQHYVFGFLCRDPPFGRLSWGSDIVAIGRVIARDIMTTRALLAMPYMMSLAITRPPATKSLLQDYRRAGGSRQRYQDT